MYYAMLIKQNCYRLMAIFVSLEDSPDLLEKIKLALQKSLNNTMLSQFSCETPAHKIEYISL